jgi:hypothetical protein
MAPKDSKVKELSADRILNKKTAEADKEKERTAAAVRGTQLREDNKRVKRSEGSISSTAPNEDHLMEGPEEYELTPGANGAASSDSPPEPVGGSSHPDGPAASRLEIMMQSLVNTLSAQVSRMEVSQVAFSKDVGSFTTRMDSFGSRLDGLEERLADQTRDVRTVIDDRFDERDASFKASVDDRFAELKKECIGLAAAAPAARASSAAASSAGPGRAVGPAGHGRSGPPRSDENCIVIVRDFPEELPRSVLRETFKELLLFVPEGDRHEVHNRINPIDKQIILVFPSSAKADSFLDTFRAKEFVYIDQDTEVDHKLSAKKGRPLAVRRRGGATHPVFAAAAVIVKAKAAFRTAELVPNPRMKAGVMHTEIHAQKGRKTTPLFSIVFREDQHETVVSAIIFATDNIFSEDECAAIRASASLQ